MQIEKLSEAGNVVLLPEERRRNTTNVPMFSRRTMQRSLAGKSFRKGGLDMRRHAFLFVTSIAVVLGMPPVFAGTAFAPLHDFVPRSQIDWGACLDDSHLQGVVDANIGVPRTVETFDDIPGRWLRPGQFDTRLIGKGILLEGITGVTTVGGGGDSGPICGGQMNVSANWGYSKVRVHFVKPGTMLPATVVRVGGFTTTPDFNSNCMEFFDISGASLGSACMQSPNYWTDVEFLGGIGCAGISYVDVYSPRGAGGIPFEVDSLFYSDYPGTECGMTVPVDVRPRSCPNPLNTAGGGVLPAAVTGTETLDVTQINPATVKLEGVSPLRWSFEDVTTPYEPAAGKQSSTDCAAAGPDGLTDLTFKFDLQSIVKAIGPVAGGDAKVLKLTGSMMNGQPIMGEDVVIIISR